MRYARKFCPNCRDYSIHFGNPLPVHCIRHNVDQQIESDIVNHEFDSKTKDILRTAIDWTFLYIEKKEREAENAV